MITGLVNLNLLWDFMEKGPPPPGQWKMSETGTGPAPKLLFSRIQGTMKCCKAAHVVLDFEASGLATCPTRVVLGRIFPVFYGRTGKMDGLRIFSNMKINSAWE